MALKSLLVDNNTVTTSNSSDVSYLPHAILSKFADIDRLNKIFEKKLCALLSDYSQNAVGSFDDFVEFIKEKSNTPPDWLHHIVQHNNELGFSIDSIDAVTIHDLLRLPYDDLLYVVQEYDTWLAYSMKEHSGGLKIQ